MNWGQPWGLPWGAGFTVIRRFKKLLESATRLTSVDEITRRKSVSDQIRLSTANEVNRRKSAGIQDRLKTIDANWR